MWQKIKNIYHLLTALFAAIYFNFPSKKLTVIGVTGTDGKTTTVNMIYHILKFAGHEVSMVSTMSVQIGSKSYEAGLHVTTPNPWRIQQLLKQAVDSKSEYFVIETTSHGLDQNRLAFVNFEIGVLTNVTHEHLDYHKSLEKYFVAKSKLFKKANISILNKDEKSSYDFFRKFVKNKMISYGQNNADINLKNFPISLQIPGSFNLFNALAATATCHSLKANKKTILNALVSFKGVSGRLEEIDLGQDFLVFIDFAHTPNALENALKTIKPEAASSKLIVVFGSAGERDKLKRPLMGEITEKYADIIILTTDDPRTEKAEEICLQIKEGIQNKKVGKDLFIIIDRRRAIQKAINLAKSADTVGFFGKGHEKSIAIGKKEVPWDEFEIVKNALERRLK